MNPAPPVIRIGGISSAPPLMRPAPALRARPASAPTRSRAVCRATHSASSASPSSKSCSRRKPSFSAAGDGSQKQWRISPIRALPTISGAMSLWPIARASSVATSVIERSLPEPMLNVPPAAWGSTERIGEGARHIRDMHEIAALLAILEDHRLLAVEQARGEDRKHARIGIGKRLSRPIDVEQAQARAFHSIGAAMMCVCALLHIFVERIDRGEARPLPFRRSDRS